jgi:glutathione S-transferase
MNFVEFVALLAVAQFLFFGAQVGKARRDSGIKAPAITGDPGFERMYRVQMNTMETLIAFFPALYVAEHYAPGVVVAGIGAVYLVGRHIYWRAYVKDPSTRSLGFLLSIAPVFLLWIIALIGTLQSFWS